MIRSFAAGLVARMPPWLRRTNGKKLILGLGDPLDTWAQNAADAVKMRFPTGTVDADALAYTGRERRIERGPGEEAATYADRTRIWLDSHRTRGGPYALLGQLFAFWRSALNVPIEVVAYSGARCSMDVDGNIVRDVVDWNGDGSGLWAQDWIFFHVPATLDLGTLETDGGIEIVDDGGVALAGTLTFAGGTIPTSLEDAFKLIPRTWTTAHLWRCTIVLMGYPTVWSARLWDYPTPVPTWDAWEATGATWGDASPIVLVIDFAP